MNSEQDWAPEPWGIIFDRMGPDMGDWCDENFEFLELYDKNEDRVMAEVSKLNEAIDAQTVASYYRILACVNACAGVPTETLARVTGAGGFGCIFARMLSDKRLFAHLKDIGFTQQYENTEENPVDPPPET